MTDWSFKSHIDDLQPYFDEAAAKFPNFSDDSIRQIAVANKALADRVMITARGVDPPKK